MQGVAVVVHGDDMCLLHAHSVTAGHMQDIDSFITQAVETLSVRPESIDEIGEANLKHGQLLGRKPEVSIVVLRSGETFAQAFEME